MTIHRKAFVSQSSFAAACLISLATVAPVAAEDFPSGWSVAPVEAPLGEARSCAATKMTGSDRGIGFTQLSSGLELLTVAVKGWSYPLGAAVPEKVKIGNAAPIELKALGQNDATLARGTFSTDKAWRAAKSLEVSVGAMRQIFDLDGLDQAFDALRTCMARKS